MGLARQAEATGDPSEAIVIYRQAAADHPGSVSLQLSYAHLLLRTGNLVEARNVILKHLRQRPHNRDLLRESGVIDAEAGNRGLALATFNHLLADDRSDWRTMIDKGVVLDIENQHAAAQNLYCAAAAIHPHSVRLATDYAMSLMLVGNMTGARDVLDPYFTDYDAPTATRSDLAILYVSTHKTTRVQELIAPALIPVAIKLAHRLPADARSSAPCRLGNL